MDRREQGSQEKTARNESKISINKLILPNTAKSETSPRLNSLPTKRASSSSSGGSIDYNEEDDDYEAEEEEYYSNDETGSKSPGSTSSPDRVSSGIYALEHRSRKKISETRRAAHLESEKKRRLNINQGFEDLRKLVPDCSIDDSKAEILRKSAGFIRKLLFLINKERITNSSNPPLPANIKSTVKSAAGNERPKAEHYYHKRIESEGQNEDVTSDDEMVAESLTMMMSCK